MLIIQSQSFPSRFIFLYLPAFRSSTQTAPALHPRPLCHRCGQCPAAHEHPQGLRVRYRREKRKPFRFRPGRTGAADRRRDMPRHRHPPAVPVEIRRRQKRPRLRGRRQRFILYNTIFLRDFQSDARSKWAACDVLAHEIGHHVSFHNFFLPLRQNVQ